MSLRVGLLGASMDTGNRGVSALSASIAKLIWQAHPDADLTLLVGARDPKPARVLNEGRAKSVPVVNFRLSPRAALQEQLWWILTLSLIYRAVPAGVREWIARQNRWIGFVATAGIVADVRGGDSFSDIYGTIRFIVGSLPALSVIWVRGSIDLLPQTYGPFRGKISRSLARYILLRSRSIWCRDRASMDEVARLTGGRRTSRLCPDVAFALESVGTELPVTDPPLAPSKHTTLIGLNVNGLMYFDSEKNVYSLGLALQYPKFLTRLIQMLLDVDSTRILIVPHTFGGEECDPSASVHLLSKMPKELRSRIHLITQEYDQHELKGIIGRCDFFIGSRMHSCIAALSQGIPTIGVAYSRKFSGVFETVGADQWVIDGKTQREDLALAAIARMLAQRRASADSLRQNIPTVIASLARTFNEMFGRATAQAAKSGG